jgi:hypothetical protein
MKPTAGLWSLTLLLLLAALVRQCAALQAKPRLLRLWARAGWSPNGGLRQWQLAQLALAIPLSAAAAWCCWRWWDDLLPTLLTALLAGLVGWWLPEQLLHWQVRVLESRTVNEFPHWVDRLTVALGCGLSWPAALRLAACNREGRRLSDWLLQERNLASPISADPASKLLRALRNLARQTSGRELPALVLQELLQWSQFRGLTPYYLPNDEREWHNLGAGEQQTLARRAAVLRADRRL